MQEIEKAYIAGLFDGEVCIYARHINKGKCKTNGPVETRITLQATSLAMIEKVKEFYNSLGIRYYLTLNQWMKKSTRPAHKIDVSRKADVLKILEAIHPYLIVKKEESKVTIDWLRYPGHLENANKYKPTIFSETQRVEYVEKLRSLKKIA